MYILILFIAFLFPQFENKAQIIEIDAGSNHPTGLYDKYADSGISFRLAYSKSFNNNGLLKWQAGVQYIGFRSDSWSDSFQGGLGPLMDVDIRNYEQGIVVNGGFRLTATNGLSKNGTFRPYIGGLVGVAIFSEKTSYDWGDDCSTLGFFMDILLDSDYCDNNNNATDLEHKTTSPVFTLDIGTNIFFNKNHKVGMDIGVRYNMLTRLKRPSTSLLYDQTENVIDQISRYIEADYYTYYIGVSLKLDSVKAQKRRENRGRGKGKLI